MSEARPFNYGVNECYEAAPKQNRWVVAVEKSFWSKKNSISGIYRSLQQRPA